jgi:penicillin-binding protein 2
MAEGTLQKEDLRDLQRRLVLLKVAIGCCLLLLGLRVWQLEVKEGAYYRELSEDNRTRLVTVEPARGLIYDRNGIVLANNVPSFSLYATLEDVKDRDRVIRRIVDLIGLDESVLRKKFSERGSQLIPRKLKDGLTLREAALVESHRLDLPGVMIQAESKRNYPAGVAAAHALGYVGEISSEQLDKQENQELHQGSIVGQYGVEKTYDRFLRGHSGTRIIEVDARGHEKRIVSTDKPDSGDDIYLTIDLRLQRLAEQLLGEETGAIVAIDPTSGEVLALASRPTFDPNTMSRELLAKQWDEIVRNPDRPLTNRATQGQYPPGSTFKIVMAVAALESKAVTPASRVHCAGVYPFGKRVFKDWKTGGHGSVDMMQALIHSCDVYFYTMGQRLGINTIASFSEQFGLGRETGIELPSERLGTVPSTSWKERVRHEQWYPGETISVAIGQGYLTVTPIQMAHVIATVANNGLAVRPRLVRSVMERATGRQQELPMVEVGRLSVQQETLDLIREGLKGVVAQGTGTRAKSSLVSIAGKTGTAQSSGFRQEHGKETPKKFRDHAWFVCYAPTDSPRIAVSVIVEHMGHGGSVSAPLARELIEAFIQMNPTDLLSGLSSVSRQSSALPPRREAA